MEGERLNIRLFLEGVEVPVISAVTSSAENAPLQCSIQLVALDEALHLEERTMVHLYKYEPQPWDYREGDGWKLAFMGEVMGFRFVKTHIQRSIVLQCMDFSSYWDSTRMMNVTGLGRQGQRLASFAGANTAVVSGGGSSNIFGEGGGKTGYDKLVKIVNKPPASFPKMKGLLAGVIHLLEQIGGFYRGSRVFKGFNDFTSVAELRVKLLQQIHAAEEDDSSMQLLKKKGLKKWVKHNIGNRGSMESFNQIASKLLQLVYHKRQAIPAPPYFPGSKNKKVKNRWVPVNLDLAETRSLLENTVSVMADRSGTAQEKAVLLNRIKGARSKLKLIDAYGNSSSQSENADLSLAIISDDVESGRMTFQTGLNEIRKVIKELWRAPKIKQEPTLEDGEYERVGMQVFKPDLFFAPPPRCNVLFPELYNSFEWSRAFLEEPTRLMLHSGSGRSGDIFGGGYSRMGVYFAPDIPSVRNSIKLSSKKFATHIMDHELTSGIIPTQVRIPWAKIFKIEAGGKGKKYKYIQRMANHEFYKKHFAARSGTASGKLNLNFLPGFPVLIIDKPMVKELKQFTGHSTTLEDMIAKEMDKNESKKDLPESETLKLADKCRADLLGKLVPEQYLGYCNTLTHSMNQKGGTTSYGLTMLRTHKEGGKKLGFDTKEKYTEVDRKTRTYYMLMVWGVADDTEGQSADEVKAFHRYGPSGNRITSVRFINKTPEIGKMYWEFTDRWVRRKWTIGRNVLVPIRGLTPKVYKITEEISNTKREVVKDLGLEAAITPPWMSKIWHLSHIGATYKKLFGVGSITDELGVSAEMKESQRRDWDVENRDLPVFPSNEEIGETTEVETGAVTK